MKITHFETFMANGGLRQQSTVQHTVHGANTTEPPLSGRWVLRFLPEPAQRSSVVQHLRVHFQSDRQFRYGWIEHSRRTEVSMTIVRLNTFLANAGLRNYLFVRLTTDTGFTGIGEATLEWQEKLSRRFCMSGSKGAW